MIEASNHNIDSLKWIYGIQVGYGSDQEFLCSGDVSQVHNHSQVILKKGS